MRLATSGAQLAASCLAALSGLAPTAAAQSPGQIEFFEKKIRPVFAKSCQACHNSKVKTAGLDLSSAEGFHRGGQSGPLVARPDSGNEGAPGLLLQVTSYEERLKMPPTGKLAASELADLAAWVKMGAPWPGAARMTAAPAQDNAGQLAPKLTAKQRAFWTFQPVRDPKPPAVKNEAWVRSPVDRFLLAKLEEKGLRPAPPAGKLTLLRRVSYDLTGLPPTEAEIRGFLADRSPEAFDRVVDRLLNSPRYGERWGRHWLDVARYADSTGNDEDHRYPYAWRYRDYVIESFNSGKPYDQFLREQIAGDLMPSPDPGKPNRVGIVATGFLALGAKAIAQQDKKRMLYDVYDEQIDVVSKTVLGLTMACARCHDHKFDPILQRDYYSWAGVFASTKSFKDAESHVSQLLFTPLVPKPEHDAWQAHRDQLGQARLAIEDVVDEEKARYNRELAPKLAGYMAAARRVYQGNEKTEDVARAAGLSAELLAKWSAYLAPEGKIRPYLEEWDSAPEKQWAVVAAKYQERYLASLTAWNERLERWREQVRRMLKEMNMPPPERPKFDGDKDPFFHEVYVLGSGPFAITEKEQEKYFQPSARERLKTLRANMEALRKAAPREPDMACAVEEGEPVRQHLFIRGDYSSLGAEVSRGFPTVFAPEGASTALEIPGKQSGRLQLAEWITRKDNPLTARVMVNRIWQRHFGEGIVRTPDNFGTMGERPTHPELLDWLASRFMEGGWKVKDLHRTIVVSSAYQMASGTGAPEADPENRLFSRFNRRRLDVEEIRDGMLAADGTADYAMGGTLQAGFGTDGENSADRLSIRPESNRRRTVYLPLRRANLPSLLNLYDFGDAVTVNGKRAITNVAPQALFMMNSDFLTERSTNLAELVSALPEAARVEAAYLRTLNRKPGAEELDSALTYVSRFRERFGSAGAESEAWRSFCRILMASNDFIYVD